MLKYDKLKNMETEEIFWDFKCSHCKSEGLNTTTLSISPLGISWKPDNVDHILTGNNQVDRFLKNLPTIRDAILKTITKNETTNLLFHCKECGTTFTVYENIRLSDVRKWLNKNHPFRMQLELSEHDRRKINERRSSNS